MKDAALKALPGIPLDGGSPVFKEPWEARAFAMTLALHEQGVFTWPQWARALSREIEQAQAAGDADLGDTYYQHWLKALESLVQDLPPR
jgi:nitrile hydratase accessory protein